MVPYPPQPPRKRGTPAWLIVLAVISAVVLLGTCAAGVSVYLIATSKAGKTAIKVIGEGSKLATDGMTAPGTAELRALGCEQAMVLDMKRVGDLLNGFEDAGLGDAGLDGVIVTCEVRRSGPAPTCDAVASTYVRAVKRASATFIVAVQREGEDNPACQGAYDPDGHPTGGI